MRWLLLPLLLLAFLSPRQECETRVIVEVPARVAGEAPTLQTPPLRVGSPTAPLGTDRAGRDARCLLSRGLARSLTLALTVLALGVLPGLVLGMWLGWRGRPLALPGEVIVLLALVLLLGRDSFRLVLALGVVAVTARLVAVRVEAVLREPFVEGALALGGGTGHLLRHHVLPHLLPGLPVVLATVLSAVFVWLMELGALGFYDRGTIVIAFTDSLDLVQDVQAFPLGADLGQLISFFRWSWLDTPEQLVWPVLLLVALTAALKDLARWGGARRRVQPGAPSS